MYGYHDHDQPAASDSWLFLLALKAILRRTPMWLASWAALLLVTLPVASPWPDWFAKATANRYAPGELVRSLDASFRYDHREGLAGLQGTTAALGAAAFLIAGLLGAFLAGGWLQVILERTPGRSMRRFVYGGGRYFGRFLRFWFLTLCVLAALHWTLYGWPWKTVVLQWLMDVPAHDTDALYSFDSEYDVRRLLWLRDGLAAAGFALVMLWGAFSRTRLALHDTTSALWAGLCTAFTILRHPLKTIRPFVLLFLVELCVVSLLAGGIMRALDEGLAESPTGTRVLLMFLLGQLALMWREITRGARYYAAARVSQELLSPLSRPDPWKSIGGPGGPQYPVDVGDDEYGVAL